LWCERIATMIGVVSLYFIFLHIFIFCLHRANSICIYVSYLHCINMALVSRPHYNCITSACL
jgi:hypothetical protein